MALIQNPGFAILVLCGIIFLIAGLIQLKYPPKRINSLYGYRTSSSMRSKEAWNFAQKYSAKISIWAGLIMILFAIIFLQFPNISKEYQVWFSLIIIFGLVGILIFLTEQKLKNFR
ncbi:MAG: SdpI family protein [Ignavibacterium album]|uniref:SdpI family protein n=1 Tax=Ignavibacterium album TaxID=591197 RepID=UPI0026ED0AC1|nr:SdpI family protein [Ignavibacterium album]MBI5661767.1 SdpI family protein [Ignavibacterium album]